MSALSAFISLLQRSMRSVLSRQISYSTVAISSLFSFVCSFCQSIALMAPFAMPWMNSLHTFFLPLSSSLPELCCLFLSLHFPLVFVPFIVVPVLLLLIPALILLWILAPFYLAWKWWTDDQFRAQCHTWCSRGCAKISSWCGMCEQRAKEKRRRCFNFRLFCCCHIVCSFSNSKHSSHLWIHLRSGVRCDFAFP